MRSDSHTDHPLRHYDRTCPACQEEAMSTDAPHSPHEDAESFMKAHVRYHIDECAVISYDTLNAMATRFFELLSAESEKAAPTASAECVVVPREPTEAMSRAGAYWWMACLHNLKTPSENADIIWMAMYDAMASTPKGTKHE